MKDLAALVTLLIVSAGALVAQRSAAVTGIVRDVHGTPQMGALVELAGPGTSVTALTNLEGRYRIGDLLPGVYQLRASASLFLPTAKREVRLRAGLKPVVNLTLLGLFESTAWLPAKPRESGEATDEWKWTLRSPANRPMLRVFDDDDPLANEPGEMQSSGESHGSVSLRATSGGFGTAGQAAHAALAHRTVRGTQISLNSQTGVAAGGGATPLMLAAILEHGRESASSHRMAARISVSPQVQNAAGASLREASVASAERLAVGDLGAVEVGSETQLLSLGRTLVVTRPFLRVSSRPLGQWSVSYALATSPAMSGYDDVGASPTELPTVLPARTGLMADAGLHQELRVRRSLGRGSVAFAVEHTGARRVAVSGFASQSSLASVNPQGIVFDRSTGAFRTLLAGAPGDGYSVLLELPAGKDFDLLGGYLNDSGLTLPATRAAFDGRQPGKRSQAMLVSVRGKVPKSGTRVSSTYRWQPASVVSVVSPYDRSDAAPYLSVHLRQALPYSRMVPVHAEVTFDGSNLLVEGYRSAPAMTQEAVLASALREMRAGLGFSF